LRFPLFPVVLAALVLFGCGGDDDPVTQETELVDRSSTVTATTVTIPRGRFEYWTFTAPEGSTLTVNLTTDFVVDAWLLTDAAFAAFSARDDFQFIPGTFLDGVLEGSYTSPVLDVTGYVLVVSSTFRGGTTQRVTIEASLNWQEEVVVTQG
jgi:hypothetical protein